MKQIGHSGETQLRQWLTTQAWEILAQNWHCPWGELDLVGLSPEGMVVFIEVKTRQKPGLDRGGLLAITPSKQEKIMKTASLFLEQHPAWQEFPCRFDVALLTYFDSPQPASSYPFLGHDAGRFFYLVNHLVNAFTP